MKQIVFSAAIFFSVMNLNAQDYTGEQMSYEASTWAFARASSSGSEKIFSQKAPVNTPDSITIRILRNADGDMVKTLRYYTAVDLLPLHIQARLFTRFSNYIPTAIIEQCSETGVDYIININKGNSWMQVHVPIKGRISIVGRYQISVENESSQWYLSTLP